MADLAGARVLVVGASGGLGGELSRGLHRAGARLVLSGRDPGRLAEVGIADAPLVPADLGDPEVGRRLVDRAVAELGGLDGVVFAAGVVAFGPVADLDDEIVDQLLVVNYLAPLRITRAALPQLAANGFLLYLTGIVAERPGAGMSAYSASKTALSGFLRATRLEARRTRIRVIEARPPHTETGLAGRPLAGAAPRLPSGLPPRQVTDRLLTALRNDETDIPSTAFAS